MFKEPKRWESTNLMESALIAHSVPSECNTESVLLLNTTKLALLISIIEQSDVYNVLVLMVLMLHDGKGNRCKDCVHVAIAYSEILSIFVKEGMLSSVVTAKLLCPLFAIHNPALKL